MRIRLLETRDLPTYRALLAAEGWTFPLDDLERLLRIGLANGAESEGRLVGASTLVLYGPLGWIGNVVVDGEARGTGLGTRLVSDLLLRARAANVETVRLHSVHRAESLYDRLGFVREGVVHSFRAPATRPASARSIDPVDDVAQIALFDAERFGADRTPLLAELLDVPANRAFLLRDARGIRAYAILKVSPLVCEIGPAAVRRNDAAAMGLLLDAALANAPPGPLEVGIPGANRLALALAKERGFTEAFTARTMRFGVDRYGGDPASILAAGGMEKG